MLTDNNGTVYNGPIHNWNFQNGPILLNGPILPIWTDFNR